MYPIFRLGRSPGITAVCSQIDSSYLSYRRRIQLRKLNTHSLDQLCVHRPSRSVTIRLLSLQTAKVQDARYPQRSSLCISEVALAPRRVVCYLAQINLCAALRWDYERVQRVPQLAAMRKWNPGQPFIVWAEYPPVLHHELIPRIGYRR
jgi:hypothetical protein